MDLQALRSNWDRWGSADPLWAVLTAPDRRFGRWREKEFFATGIYEIEQIFQKLRTLGVTVESGRALDFGCGVGRLTSALAERFTCVDGVDIAPSMLAEARRRFGENPRMRFQLVADDSLSLYSSETFDFVYTAHVLQHMEPRYSRRYIEEFIRILRPNGTAVVQVTTEPYLAPGTTLADRCLPDEGYRAQLRIVRVPNLRPGRVAVIRVLVANASRSVWRSKGVDGWFLVTVGNRWHRAGDLLVGDDGRATLPMDLVPGQTAVVDLEIRPPDTPGDYELEIDLVQEGCAWFSDRGASSLRLAVEVHEPYVDERVISALTSHLPARAITRLEAFLPGRLKNGLRPVRYEEQPVMEMYGIPIATMRRWIDEAGGRVVADFDWGEVGDTGTDWLRHAFVIAKSPG